MPSIRVKVVSAASLIGADHDGKSDPYVIVKVGAQSQRTSVIQKNLNPTWNETFTLQISNPHTDRLELEVFDKDQVGTDDSLGKCSVILSDLVQGQEKPYTLKLEGGSVGENVMLIAQQQAMKQIKGFLSKNKTGQASTPSPVSNKGMLTFAVTALDFSGGGFGGPPGAPGGFPPQQGGWGAPPPQQGGWGAPPPQQGGWGAPPPQQGGWGAPPPQQGGWGAPPPQAGGWGAPPGAPPPQQGGWGAPPPQQGGWGAPPPQQGGWGAPPGAPPPQQGGWGAPPPQQGGWGAPPPQQGGWGAPPPQQGGWGAPPPQQGGWGAPPPNQQGGW